jgi:hypothetical protein
MRTITAVTDPIWGDEAHTSILCQVTTAEVGTHPFNCMPSDPELHGQQLWRELNTGKYGAISPYVAPRQPPAKSAALQPGPKVIG